MATKAAPPQAGTAAQQQQQQQLRRTADFSSLWGDDCLSDFTIHVKIKPESPAPEAVEEEEAEAAAEATPAAEAGAAAETEEKAAADAPVVTIRAHCVVLCQRSKYFDRMIRNKELTEGRTREATFLFAEEQGASAVVGSVGIVPS